MSRDVPRGTTGDRAHGEPPLDPHEPGDAPDSPAMLSTQLRAALMRELGPSPADRARNRDGLRSALAAGLLPGTVQRVDAAMASRAVHAAGVKTSVLGHGFAYKVMLSSLVLAGVTGAGVALLPRAAAPRVTRTAQTDGAQARPAPVATRPAAAAVEPANEAIDVRTRVDDVSAPARRKIGSPEPRQPVKAPVHRTHPPQPRAAANNAIEPSRTVGAAPPTEAAPAPPPLPAAASVSDASSQPAPALAAELKLIRAAAAALEQHQHARALGLLGEYRARYPSGALLVEADALRAIALCASHDPRADQAGDAFIRLHAGSALGDRVRRACEPPH